MKIKLETHYGKEVYTNTKMDKLRKKECLCLNCSRMRGCAPANRFYHLCYENNIALAVTRCPYWRK